VSGRIASAFGRHARDEELRQMAEQHAVSAEGHPDMDYAEHEHTYRLFVSLLKYSLAGVVIILIVLALLTL
jgi:Bacterial aa3 type cytochrome c oxidase subunit IV